MIIGVLDRCTEIEKANRILLEKMTNIMTSQTQAHIQSAGLIPPPHPTKKLHLVPNHQMNNNGVRDGSNYLHTSVEFNNQQRSRSLNRNVR